MWDARWISVLVSVMIMLKMRRSFVVLVTFIKLPLLRVVFCIVVVVKPFVFDWFWALPRTDIHRCCSIITILGLTHHRMLPGATRIPNNFLVFDWCANAWTRRWRLDLSGAFLRMKNSHLSFSPKHGISGCTRKQREDITKQLCYVSGAFVLFGVYEYPATFEQLATISTDLWTALLWCVLRTKQIVWKDLKYKSYFFGQVCFCGRSIRMYFTKLWLVYSFLWLHSEQDCSVRMDPDFMHGCQSFPFSPQNKNWWWEKGATSKGLISPEQGGQARPRE